MHATRCGTLWDRWRPPYSFQETKWPASWNVYRDEGSQWDTYVCIFNRRAAPSSWRGSSCYFTARNPRCSRLQVQPALRARSLDISMCIVIEWYNGARGKRITGPPDATLATTYIFSPCICACIKKKYIYIYLCMCMQRKCDLVSMRKRKEELVLLCRLLYQWHNVLLFFSSLPT